MKRKELFHKMGLLSKEIIRKNGELIKIEDLSNGSGVNVDVECDGCDKILKNVKWVDYNKCVKENGKYYCSQCAKNGFKKWVSFKEWCYDNLSKEKADKILLRWDYNNNIDRNGNIIKPENISHGSNKLYWFKCLDHPEHKPEQKNINSFTNGKQDSIDCHQCNSILVTHPHLIKFLVNKDDGLKYSVGSTKKIVLKCIDCGFEKEKSIYDWVKKGFGCPRCSDGVSYPEKFLFGFVEQLNLLFQTQLSKTTFKWCKNYKYDFYIPNLNCIIETHGLQHYKEKDNNWDSLKKIQQNDKNKEQLAKENGIKYYIILDCRESNINWIKDSIIQSELSNLLNFKEEDINWLKCHEYACSNRVKTVCDLWKLEIKNTLEISNQLKINRSTIIKYLKQGNKLGWCDYNPKEILGHKEYLYKKIICLTTNEIFNSILDASNKYDIQKTSISACCRKEINKSAGKHPKTGDNMIWMFYKDYITKNKKEIDDILNNVQDKIICFTTGEIFNSQTEASRKYNVRISGISQCCSNKLKSAGKHPDTKEKLVWKYLKDYQKIK